MASNRNLCLGYSSTDLANSAYAGFFNSDMAPLPEAVREAVLTGPIAQELMPGIGAVQSFVKDRSAGIDTGFTYCSDGETRVFDLTKMPGVSPEMWKWWFAWHGSEDLRYKLWHPRAHVSASWADGKGETGDYVGRTSYVVEYIGAELLHGAIRFVRPSTLGIDEEELARSGAIAICARIGPQSPAIDAGWLVHHVYPVSGGSEMRSYFWLGGRHISSRSGNGLATGLIRLMAKVFPKATRVPAAELLVHCAQEMGHLASILPGLYGEFGPGAKGEIGQ